MRKRAYTKIPTGWINEKWFMSMSDAEFRIFITDYVYDPDNTHYEVWRHPVRKAWEKVKSYIAPKIMRRDKYQCQYCGSKKFLEIDHIVPIAKGGSNEMDNLQVLCRKCNRGKGAKIP